MAKLKTLALKSNFLEYAKALMITQLDANFIQPHSQSSQEYFETNCHSHSSSSDMIFDELGYHAGYPYVRDQFSVFDSSSQFDITGQQSFQPIEPNLFEPSKPEPIESLSKRTSTSRSLNSNSSTLKLTCRIDKISKCLFLCFQVTRDEKSLGIMSQKFLMLFLTSEVSILSFKFLAYLFIFFIRKSL